MGLDVGGSSTEGGEKGLDLGKNVDVAMDDSFASARQCARYHLSDEGVLGPTDIRVLLA